MNNQTLCLFLALPILLAGTSCSTSRLSKNSSAQNREEIFARIPTEAGEKAIVESTKLEPQIEAGGTAAAAPVIAEATIIEVETTTPAVEKITPAPAIVVSSPTKEQKAVALEAEKAALASVATGTAKSEKVEAPKSDDFAPNPYFTLFTKTESDATEAPTARESASAVE